MPYYFNEVLTKTTMESYYGREKNTGYRYRT